MIRRDAAVPLNGRWEFTTGPGDGGWVGIDVPDYWNGGGWINLFGEFYRRNGWHGRGGEPAPFPDFEGIGRYRREFRVPCEWRGRRVHLSFRAVAARCAAWLNGRPAGEHLGAYSPFTLDVTELVSWDAANLLTMRVWSKACFYASDAIGERRYFPGIAIPGRKTELPLGETKNSGGVWQPVELFSTGLPYVAAVKVSSPRPDSLSGAVTLAGCPDGTPGEVRVNLTLVGAGGREPVGGCSLYTGLPEHPFNVLPFAMRGLATRPWSPRSPVLYDLIVQVTRRDEDAGAGTGDGCPADTCRLRIGFRTFEARDGRFYLNGIPCYLRGAGTPPHAYVPNDEAYARKFLSACKELNVEVVRFHTEPPSEVWLDACDELGLLAIYEGPLMQQVPDIHNTREEFRQLVGAYGHHPSIAVWCIGNENGQFDGVLTQDVGYRSLRAYLGDIRSAIDQEDGSRPVVHDSGFLRHGDAGDAKDIHFYGGWYTHCLFAYEAFLLRRNLEDLLFPEAERKLPASEPSGSPAPGRDTMMEKILGGQALPLILTEFLAAYTDDDGRFLQYPIGIRRIGRRPAGEGHQRSSWYQAFLLKETVEILRRSRDEVNRLSGVAPFALFNLFSRCLDPDRISVKPAGRALAEALAPLLASIRCYGRHVFAGRRLLAEVFLVHDDAGRGDVPDGTLEFELVGQHGGCRVEGEVPVGPVAYYGVRRVPLDVGVPEGFTGGVTGTELRVRWLTAEGEILARNRMGVVVASKEWCARDVCRPLFLFDPARKTRHVLEGAGALPPGTCAPGDDVAAAAAAAAAVVVGRDGLRYLDGAARSRLVRAVELGAKVVVLEQDPSAEPDGQIRVDWIPGVMFTIRRELKDNHWNCPEADDFVHVGAPEHPAFEGLEPEHFRMWNGNTVLIGNYIVQGTEADVIPAKTIYGRRAGHRIRKSPGVVSLAECHDFLRFDAVVEIPLGRGSFVFSQLEACRRYGDDPIATRYLNNLLRYAAVPGGVGEA